MVTALGLDGLPLEVLYGVLDKCENDDLIRLVRVNRTLYEKVTPVLWRNISFARPQRRLDDHFVDRVAGPDKAPVTRYHAVKQFARSGSDAIRDGFSWALLNGHISPYALACTRALFVNVDRKYTWFVESLESHPNNKFLLAQQAVAGGVPKKVVRLEFAAFLRDHLLRPDVLPNLQALFLVDSSGVSREFARRNLRAIDDYLGHARGLSKTPYVGICLTADGVDPVQAYGDMTNLSEATRYLALNVNESPESRRATFEYIASLPGTLDTLILNQSDLYIGPDSPLNDDDSFGYDCLQHVLAHHKDMRALHVTVPRFANTLDMADVPASVEQLELDFFLGVSVRRPMQTWPMPLGQDFSRLTSLTLRFDRGEYTPLTGRERFCAPFLKRLVVSGRMVPQNLDVVLFGNAGSSLTDIVFPRISPAGLDALSRRCTQLRTLVVPQGATVSTTQRYEYAFLHALAVSFPCLTYLHIHVGCSPSLDWRSINEIAANCRYLQHFYLQRLPLDREDPVYKEEASAATVFGNQYFESGRPAPGTIRVVDTRQMQFDDCIGFPPVALRFSTARLRGHDLPRPTSNL